MTQHIGAVVTCGIIFTNASWFYILAVALILLSVTFLGLSRYGDIKLGPDHAQPDFSYHSWFAMLFSAGMGIGLMFFVWCDWKLPGKSIRIRAGLSISLN